MLDEYGAKPTKVSIVFDAAWLAKPEEDHSQPFRYELELKDSENVPRRYDMASYEALFHFPQGKPRWLFGRTSEKNIYVSKDFGIGANDSQLRAARKNSSVISTLAKLNNELAMRIHADLVNLQSNLWSMTRARVRSGREIKLYSPNPKLVE